MPLFAQPMPLHPCYRASWEGFALEQTLLAHGERERCVRPDER